MLKSLHMGGKAGEASAHPLLLMRFKHYSVLGVGALPPFAPGEVLWPSRLARCCVSARHSGWVPAKLTEWELNFSRILAAYNQELWCVKQGTVILTGSALAQLTWHLPLPLKIRVFPIRSWKRNTGVYTKCNKQLVSPQYSFQKVFIIKEEKNNDICTNHG